MVEQFLDAAYEGNFRRVKQLADRVDINAVDRRGESALHIAAYNGYEPIVRYLIDKGADVLLFSKHVQRPLQAGESRYGSGNPMIKFLKGVEAEAQERAPRLRRKRKAQKNRVPKMDGGVHKKH